MSSTSSKGREEKGERGGEGVERGGEEEREDISMEMICQSGRSQVSTFELPNMDVRLPGDGERREKGPEMKEVGAGSIETRTHLEAICALAGLSVLLDTARTGLCESRARWTRARSIGNSFPLSNHFDTL